MTGVGAAAMGAATFLTPGVYLKLGLMPALAAATGGVAEAAPGRGLTREAAGQGPYGGRYFTATGAGLLHMVDTVDLMRPSSTTAWARELQGLRLPGGTALPLPFVRGRAQSCRARH